MDHRLQAKQAKTLERIERQKQEAVEREMGRAAALEEKEQSLLEASMVLEDKRKVKEVRRFLTQKIGRSPPAILRQILTEKWPHVLRADVHGRGEQGAGGGAPEGQGGAQAGPRRAGRRGAP